MKWFITLVFNFWTKIFEWSFKILALCMILYTITYIIMGGNI